MAHTHTRAHTGTHTVCVFVVLTRLAHPNIHTHTHLQVAEVDIPAAAEEMVVAVLRQNERPSRRVMGALLRYSLVRLAFAPDAHTVKVEGDLIQRMGNGGRACAYYKIDKSTRWTLPTHVSFHTKNIRENPIVRNTAVLTYIQMHMLFSGTSSTNPSLTRL